MQTTDVIELELPAEYEYLDLLNICVTGLLDKKNKLAASPRLTYSIQLAVQEACTNIVEHAYAGQPEGQIKATLALERYPDRLIIDLEDTGASFDLSKAPAPKLAELQLRGYGLFLIHKLMDQVNYYPQPGKNRWLLIKNL